MRLVTISNRLPFTLQTKEGRTSFKPSAGGLVSGLESFLKKRCKTGADFDYLWVGWPGSEAPRELESEITERALAEHKSFPIFLTKEEIKHFYHGFCNETIWPLFHYFTEYTLYNEDDWHAYQRINALFAEKVEPLLKPGDFVWVHDYQLMLLPQYLRQRQRNEKIGFFLHIPFPSYEVYRLLPRAWGKELLEGLIGADLVGFHTHDYCKYFTRCVLRMLGHEPTLGNIQIGSRRLRVDTFPMGIDFNKFNEAPKEPASLAERQKIRKHYGDAKIVFSLDRLDYTKGLRQRLLAFEKFLEDYPAAIGKVVLVMVVVPSRDEVPMYRNMKEELEKQVSRINGRFGSLEWEPIVYLYSSLSSERLAALYGESDVALITPLRDGMNLIAKEYLASRQGGDGVLILSEMAGAAQELGEALLINPNHKSEISAALVRAVEMPVAEQIRRNGPMLERLKHYDVQRWGEDFVEQLCNHDMPRRKNAVYLSPQQQKILAEKLLQKKDRLFFLDYDGTLVPFTGDPKKAEPDERLLSLLTALMADHKNQIYIISGRDRATLTAWFKDLRLGLAAEHGAWIRHPGADWGILKPMNANWKEQIMPLLRLYVDRLPGAFVEEKEFSLTWHYRKADWELGAQRALELIDDLVAFTANIDVQVLEGSRVVEVRNMGVNKGEAALICLERFAQSETLAIGDDITDEDLFASLPPTATSIKVGMPRSKATYYLHSCQEVRGFLARLV